MSLKKKVRFSKDVKTNDGLSPNLINFGKIINDFFDNSDDRYLTLKKIIVNGDISTLENMIELINDLIIRITENEENENIKKDKKGVFIISCDCKNNNKIDKIFIPWLIKLSNLITNIIEKIKVIIEIQNIDIEIQKTKLTELSNSISIT
jgi:hypothetical protein